MLIKKLHIISFGMLSDRHIAFGDGLNVIEGENETGKSTVGAFIRFVFYGLDKAGRERYVSWGMAGCSGSVTVESGGVEYRIERELLLNRVRDKVGIYRGGELIKTDKAPWEMFIGVPENVFENTAFTGDLGSAVGGQGLPEAIENIVFSGDETVSTKKAVKKIDEARTALYYKNKKGGKIYELENTVSELEFRLAAAKTASEKIFSLDDSIRTRKARLQSNKERIETITAQLEDYETYRRIRETEEYEKNLETLKQSTEELGVLEKKYAKNGFLPDRDFADGLRSYQASAVELKENSVKAAAELERTSAELNKSANTGIMKIAAGAGGIDALRDMYGALDGKAFSFGKRCTALFVFAAAFAVIAGVLAYFGYTVPYAYISGGAAVVALIFGLITASKASKLKSGLMKLAAKLGTDDPDMIPDVLDSVTDDEKESLKKSEAYGEAKKNKAASDERLAAFEKKVRAYTGKYKQTGIDGLPALISETDAIVSELSNTHKQIEMAQYKTRLSGERVSGNDKGALRSKLHGALSEDQLRDFKADERRTELNLLVRQNEAIAEKVSEEEKNFAAANATFTLPASIYAKLLSAREELEAARLDHEAYTMAFDKLNEASTELRSSISPTLAADAGEYIKRFSDGKYESLGVSNKLDLTYTGAGMTHAASTLSSGTQDIAYVSLRLALMNLIYPNRVPAFFDDTFARVDDRRAFNIIGTLASLDRQTVVFTCHGRDAGYAEQAGGTIIRL